MPRGRNQRRVLIERVRGMRRLLDRILTTWNVPGTVFEGNGWRKRAAHEYPENSRTDWVWTIHTLDNLISEAQQLRAEAYEQWKLLGEKGAEK
jgi:hypothetical protein